MVEQSDTWKMKDKQFYKYGFTSPFTFCHMEKFFSSMASSAFPEKIKTETHFKQMLGKAVTPPDIIMMFNFIIDRDGISRVARSRDIDTVSTEDGFFPHYQTMYADPLGFSWESSVCRMIFRGALGKQRELAMTTRNDWTLFNSGELPPEITPPFVLFPLQLIGDHVNKCDLALKNWCSVISHFRECLPEKYQLVLREHPRAEDSDRNGIQNLLTHIPNTILVKPQACLKTMIRSSSAVAGVNSHVLLEARLMFNKPTYVYGRGYHTGHPDLFYNVRLINKPRLIQDEESVDRGEILESEYLEEYRDWFLSQLLVRQIKKSKATDFVFLLEWMKRMSYQSFISHGESIFHIF